MKHYLYRMFRYFFGSEIDKEIADRLQERTDELHASYQFAKRMDQLLVQRKNTPTG